MRTTVAIDDELLAAAKELAQEQATTLGRVIEDALRELLSKPDRQEVAPLPVFDGGGGFQPGIDLTSNRSLQEALDEGLELDQLK